MNLSEISEEEELGVEELKYSDLAEDEKALICNGCGGKGGWVKPPQFMFHASCNHHDFGYWKGGTDADRKDCDVKFLQAMIGDAAILDGLHRRLWHYVMAFAYYLAVRRCGGKFFNYGPKRGFRDLVRRTQGE